MLFWRSLLTVLAASVALTGAVSVYMTGRCPWWVLAGAFLAAAVVGAVVGALFAPAARLRLSPDELAELDSLRKQLESGGDVNHEDRHGGTLLHREAQTGSAAAVEMAVSAGADVHVRSDNGGTLLMYAAHFGDARFVDMLLEAGVDVRAKNKYGRTALGMAAVGGLPWDSQRSQGRRGG